MASKTWTAGVHEIVETVVREQYEPYDRLVLRGHLAALTRWTVLHVKKDPREAVRSRALG